MMAEKRTDGKLGGLIEAARGWYEYVRQAAAEGAPIHEVEKQCWQLHVATVSRDSPPAALFGPAGAVKTLICKRRFIHGHRAGSWSNRNLVDTGRSLTRRTDRPSHL